MTKKDKEHFKGRVEKKGVQYCYLGIVHVDVGPKVILVEFPILYLIGMLGHI